MPAIPGSATASARLPVEPHDVLALTRRWGRIGVAGLQEVAQVEVGVTSGAGVDVDVGQLVSVAPVVQEAGRQTGLLHRFAHGGVPRQLTGVDVAAGLDPDPEPLVAVQDDPPGADDQGRGGDVHRVGVLVERVGQAGHLDGEALDADPLPLVDRRAGGHGRRHLRQQLVVVGSVVGRSSGGATAGDGTRSVAGRGGGDGSAARVTGSPESRSRWRGARSVRTSISRRWRRPTSGGARRGRGGRRRRR